MLKSELSGLSSVLPKIFGYYIVQAGGPVGLLSASSIHNHIILNPPASTLYGNLSAIKCNLDELPFLPESVDTMVLFHTLEFSKNPKAVLHEAYSAIINDGYLIILGFNPRSLWGVSKWLRRKKDSIWSGNWINPGKLRHWLTNLGFHVGDYQTCYFRPSSRKTEKLLFMEGLGQILWPYCGASYMFVAHKTATIITPVGPLKHLINHHKMPGVLPKPAPRATR